jgi:hypothetical protein
VGAQVKIDDRFALRVVGHGEIVFMGDLLPERDAAPEEAQNHFAATLEGAGPAQLSALRSALLNWRKRYSRPDRFVTVSVSAAPEKDFSPHLDDPVGPDVLLLAGERLLVRAWAKVDAPSAREATHRLLSPLLKRHRASWVDVGLEKYWTLAVDWPTRGRTVADAWEFHHD